MKKYLLYIVLLFFVSCKSQKPIEVSKEINKIELSEPHIVFYLLKAKKQEEKITVEITQIKNVKGKLKGIFSPYIDNLKDKNWLVSFQNSLKKNVIQVQIANPLIEEVEFINDGGNLEKKVINHKEKDFVIRVPYDNSINSITFESLIQENQQIIKKKLAQFDIK